VVLIQCSYFLASGRGSVMG